MSSPNDPYVGKTFETFEEARLFYKEYAKKFGFEIRNATSRRSARTQEVDKVLLVCNKEGKGAAKKKASTCAKRKREKLKYTCCKAITQVKFDGMRWVVMNFVADHNHSLVDKPNLAKFWNSHSRIPVEEVQFLTLLHECNVDTSRMMQLMSELYGSAKFVSYHTKHVSNLRSAIRSREGNSDMSQTIAYFYEMQKEEDPNFSLSTYLTNKYKMPFAPFIAINRHGLTIQVGCGFMRNESTESYMWLFQMFLEAMNGLQPVNIIMDQDLAMAAAIRVVFVCARHQCCYWHILSKLEARLGNFFKTREGMESEYNDTVNYSLTPAEFEARWTAMIDRHAAHDNEILVNLYQIRHLWVPAYFMDRFFPFIQSTQRSESFNGVLKRYVNPHNSILDFCCQYKTIQEKTDVAEDESQWTGLIALLDRSKNSSPWTRFPIEKHAIEVYTRNIYFRFRAEFEKIADYIAGPISLNVYRLSSVLDFAGGYGTRSYDMMFDKENTIINCQCYNGLKKVVEPYILKRWMPAENATSLGVFPQSEQIAKLPEKSKKLVRHANMPNSFSKIAHQAYVLEEPTNIMISHINSIKAEFVAFRKAKRENKNNAMPYNNAAEHPEQSIGSKHSTT
ncbi:hypothetical protein BS78_09G118600 [Paspalum vaginatum]|nr:hypothetical protein BS78_09G118600 [Paspalum vaginatum]